MTAAASGSAPSSAVLTSTPETNKDFKFSEPVDENIDNLDSFESTNALMNLDGNVTISSFSSCQPSQPSPSATIKPSNKSNNVKKLQCNNEKELHDEKKSNDKNLERERIEKMSYEEKVEKMSYKEILEINWKIENRDQDMKPYWPGPKPIDPKILSVCPNHLLYALDELSQRKFHYYIQEGYSEWIDSIKRECEKRPSHLVAWETWAWRQGLK